MRIAIDMQALQASNSKRGIGRYTSGLVKKILEINHEHDIFLVLNGLLTDGVEYVKKEFSGLLSPNNIYVWQAVSPVDHLGLINDGRRNAAQKIREDFISRLEPDIILVTSLFEGLGDDAVVSISNYESSIPTAVILYDLIPLIHKSIYLDNDLVSRWYLNKIDNLKRADLLLSISDSSGREASKYLSFPESQVVNISTACDEMFHAHTYEKSELETLRNELGLDGSFIMYTGGIDHRKNIEGLIKAYAKLSEVLKNKYQLAIVCSIQDSEREKLLNFIKSLKINKSRIIFTNYVSDKDLVKLYNSCDLFVFPSWHEGFGLPVLEAMKCGKAVIGGKLSSIPEVIGLNSALFDPFDEDDICKKITQVLTDDSLKLSIEEHAVEQAKLFSWDLTATATLKALTKLHEDSTHTKNHVKSSRPRLAFVSPLPPEKSGISDYSAELLMELSIYYEIDVIINQTNGINDSYINSNFAIRNCTWFRNNSDKYQRVLYHFGNSDFHSHMFDLLDDIPGVTVLHDFYLSGIVAHMDVVTNEKPGFWDRELLQSAGWKAVKSRYLTNDTADVVFEYPCNLSVLQNSLGIIAHSDYAKKLALSFYGEQYLKYWSTIPLLKKPVTDLNKIAARQKLGFDSDSLVISSFGLLGRAKLNDKLLSAWLSSPLANKSDCYLVFVGQNESGIYGRDLLQKIKSAKSKNKVKITGWVSAEEYKSWLTASDIGVQLRMTSRGETSAAVLDCMNYGLATIVNANGSMADLDDSSVWKLDDDFTEEELTEALTELYNNKDKRKKLQTSAHHQIRHYHNPRHCALEYYKTIESFYTKPSKRYHNIVNDIINDDRYDVSKNHAELAVAISNNFEPLPRTRQLLLDISELVQRDARSGIQRVVRSILNELLNNPPKGWNIEPVYATCSEKGYFYAREFTAKFLGIPQCQLCDAPIESWRGDIFFGLDLQPNVVTFQQDFLLNLKAKGVKVKFAVYDILPVTMSNMFFDGAKETYTNWLKCITQFDGAIGISKTVASELGEWIRENNQSVIDSYSIGYFHLGADLASSVPTSGRHDDHDVTIEKITSCTSFLMVSTIEPRKCHAQVLDAFELLWNKGSEINLVIVGKKGWLVESFITRLSEHKELGHRLIWLEGISDEYLDIIYSSADCLILASLGEGFGLPLIEAAHYNLPIIARDIPVFREIAGDHAYYFQGNQGFELAESISDWLFLSQNEGIPNSEGMGSKTWAESAKQLTQVLLTDNQ